MAADKTLIEGARRVAETKATAAMGAQAFQKGLAARQIFRDRPNRLFSIAFAAFPSSRCYPKRLESGG